MDEVQRCGVIAIVGRPNVGKSTLLNRLLGQKLSITSRRPQTTRHRILGIKTTEHAQAIYVDTPGIHLAGKRAMSRYLNRTATSALHGVNAVIFVTEGTRWGDEDEEVLRQIRREDVATLLVVNKVDRVEPKTALLPHIQFLQGLYPFRHVLLVSALAGDGIEVLEQKVTELLPIGAPLFPEDQLTDRSQRFFAAELVREKLTRRLAKEVPYALTVEVEEFREEQNLLRIDATIWVERASQKAIVIGKGGEVLKLVGQQAREEMELWFERKVFLRLWVKVREGWSDDERALRSLGYTD